MLSHTFHVSFFFIFILLLSVVHLPKSNKTFFSRATVVPTTTASESVLKSMATCSISHKQQKNALGRKTFLSLYFREIRQRLCMLSTDFLEQTHIRSNGPLPCWRNINIGRNNFSFLFKETDGASVFFFMVKDSVDFFGVCCFHILLHGQGEQVLMRQFFTRVTF